MKALIAFCLLAAASAQAVEPIMKVPTGEPVVTVPVATPAGIIDTQPGAILPLSSPDTAVTTTTTKTVMPSGAPQTITTTTSLHTATPISRTVHFRDGTRIEIDSDGSVHRVYPDGARTAAPDGVHILSEGGQITVKNGVLIP